MYGKGSKFSKPRKKKAFVATSRREPPGVVIMPDSDSSRGNQGYGQGRNLVQTTMDGGRVVPTIAYKGITEAQQRLIDLKKEQDLPPQNIYELNAASDAGMPIEWLYEKFPSVLSRGGIGRFVQDKRRILAQKRYFKTHVTVLEGDSGTGKSETAEIWSLGKRVFRLMVSDFDNQQWWDDYDNEEVVIIEDYAGQIAWQELLSLLDAYPMKIQVKGSSAQFNSHYIIITTNVPIEAWYEERFEDAVGIEPLMRRIDTRIVFNVGYNQRGQREVNMKNQKVTDPQWYNRSPGDFQKFYWPKFRKVSLGKLYVPPHYRVSEIQNVSYPFDGMKRILEENAQRYDESYFEMLDDNQSARERLGERRTQTQQPLRTTRQESIGKRSGFDGPRKHQPAKRQKTFDEMSDRINDVRLGTPDSLYDILPKPLSVSKKEFYFGENPENIERRKREEEAKKRRNQSPQVQWNQGEFESGSDDDGTSLLDHLQNSNVDIVVESKQNEGDESFGLEYSDDELFDDSN